MFYRIHKNQKKITKIIIIDVSSIFDQCSAYVETRQLVFTSKIFEKHLWKSDFLSKDAVR